MATWIEVGYAPNVDTTFIIQYTQEEHMIVREEVIGFYHGEPESKWTEFYKDKGTVMDIR